QAKLERRSLIPKPSRLGHDQVPVVGAVIGAELIRSFGTSPEIGGKVEPLSRITEALEGVGIEGTCIVLARIHLGEGSAQVCKAEDRTPGPLGVEWIQDSERSA